MKILVLVKEVPDTYGSRALDLETGLADRAAGDVVLDEICERAMEVALSYADCANDTEVVALTMGPQDSAATLRKAIAMGAGSAIHVADEGLRGADLQLTARVLAAAIKRADADLVIAGSSSTDGGAGLLPSMLAELLEMPCITSLSEVELTAGSVSGARRLETGLQRVSTHLPAVIAITEALPEGRFPGFKSIMAAKKKPVELLTAEELGIELDPAKAASSIMLTVSERAARTAGVKITDEGDAGNRLAEFLIENRLV